MRERLSELIGGYRQTALIYVAAKLGLVDLIASGEGAAAALASKLGVQAGPLQRVLRGLAAIGILQEDSGGHFALTELGAGLRSGTGGSFREQAIVAGEEYLPAWGALLHTVRTGEAAFPHVFGMSAWQHREQYPELGSAFDAALFEQTAGFAFSLAEAHDFSNVREVVDLGGGAGGLLAGLLARHASLRGVLFDLPSVVARAETFAAGKPWAGRLSLVGGDFFQSAPAGADLYLLKSVLHDWADQACGRILTNCRRALKPAARLLVIERALPERAAEDPETILLDLHMMAVLGGRERTPDEYRQLAAGAGLELVAARPLAGSFHLMEFQPQP